VQTGLQDELIAAKLDSQLPAESVAADGFPIDFALQKRARRAAIGYGLLALYYVSVVPFVLRFVRWGSLEQWAEDVFARGEVVAKLLAYLVLNLILAACAWRVISMRIATSWTVVGLAAAWTFWACGSLGLGVWRIATAAPQELDALAIVVSISLLLGYVVSFGVLASATIQFNSRRAEVLARHEGRVRGA
jgi:hypothetical protein